jgi:hypothetical protein
MPSTFWKDVRELAAMRESIPPERRALSGIGQLYREWKHEFEDERIHIEERGDFTGRYARTLALVVQQQPAADVRGGAAVRAPALRMGASAMSRFGRRGARCDGCGIISRDEQGYYVNRATGTGGNITNHGRECPHDYCDECEDGLAPRYACPKCGVRPDASDRADVHALEAGKHPEPDAGGIDGVV